MTGQQDKPRFQRGKSRFQRDKPWPLILDDKDIIQSAGGIVIRNNSDVLVIFRPKHKDWSFPKGRIEPNETLLECAIREVREETFCNCALGRKLPTVRYIDRNGSPKEIQFWLMTLLTEGVFAANEEVSEILWCSLRKAFKILTYKTDRMLLKKAFS